MTWQLIETLELPTEDEYNASGFKPVLVSNGKRVGEATIKEDYSLADWEGEQPVPFRWAWTHHSTCSCCHSFMDPQPTHWQPMPEGPELTHA